ncbi:Serine/threonine-protein kinase Nek6 isoform X2 [Aphelenchoides fujianensis]|nr:Serine/threonine-protein kinase Nek6 isoform X2 [Aphelenchoides fujianensis]
MLSNNNATGAAGRKPPRAPDARWPQEARGYEKERELGTGSFATVDLVHVRGALRQKAALKTIEDAQKRARLLLVLEFASRGNLEQLITDTYFTKQRRLPEAQIWRLFAQIAAAIAHVHERRILHRDLKPANVLFDGPQMAVKVCDFGLCRLFSQNTVRANTQVGTPYYVSPERSTQSGYNFASDVWSLGCILYEMACGGSPFVGERSNEFALNLRIQAADFPPLPDGERRTPHLKLLVRLCLQVDTGRRPAAAQVQRFAEKMAAFFQ